MARATRRRKSCVVEIGRDAKTGRFIPVDKAKRRPKTTVVETIRRRPRCK